jgi:hypothetical protein
MTALRHPERPFRVVLGPSTIRPRSGFTPLSFAENMAAMVLFGLIIALAARSQLKVEKS